MRIALCLGVGDSRDRLNGLPQTHLVADDRVPLDQCVLGSELLIPPERRSDQTRVQREAPHGASDLLGHLARLDVSIHREPDDLAEVAM